MTSASEILTVGIPPLTAVNDNAGTLTLTGQAIGGNAMVVLGTVANPGAPPLVNGTGYGVNAVTTVNAASLTGNGISITMTKPVGAAIVHTLIGSEQADNIAAHNTVPIEGVYSITGGGGDDTLLGANGADTISGGAGADTITGGEGADSITGGEGADSITGGLGADVINVGAADGASDIVVMTTGGAIAVDAVSGFLVGAATPDNVNVDLSDLNALVVGNMQLAGISTTALAVDVTPTVTNVTTAYDLGTVVTSDMLTISSTTAFDATTVATALKTGGTHALTLNEALTATDGFLIAYDNNVDTFLAYITSALGAVDNATVGDWVVTNVLQLVGVADASTFLTNNVDIVA
jgi:hypothetical protein